MLKLLVAVGCLVAFQASAEPLRQEGKPPPAQGRQEQAQLQPVALSCLASYREMSAQMIDWRARAIEVEAQLKGAEDHINRLMADKAKDDKAP